MLKGIDKLSSTFKSVERASIIPPTIAENIVIRYSPGKLWTLGAKKTTGIEAMIKAIVPSRDFLKNLCLPNFLPNTAALASDKIKIANAFMKINLGKIITQIRAEINTHVAPFKFFALWSLSCWRSIGPNNL